MYLLVFCQGVNCRIKQTKPRTNRKILVLVDPFQFVRMKPCPRYIHVYRYCKSSEIFCSVPMIYARSVSWSIPMAPWHCNNTNRQNTMPRVSVWKDCLPDLAPHEHEVVLLSSSILTYESSGPQESTLQNWEWNGIPSDKILNASYIGFLLPLLTALFMYLSSS